MLHLFQVLIARYRAHMAALNEKMSQFDRMHASH